MSPIDIIIATLIIIGFIVGIRLMQFPSNALWGNRLGAFSMLLAILFTLYKTGLLNNPGLWLLILIGVFAGIILGQYVKMIQMPQMVALFNGLGGGASALIAGAVFYTEGQGGGELLRFTALLAFALGIITFTGSIIAALKLQGLISQKPFLLKGHKIYLSILILSGVALIFTGTALPEISPFLLTLLLSLFFIIYGLLMALRVGGADMPIIIAFFNSLSGIATAICGLVVQDLYLVGVGSLVGVAGMILTQIMCRAMNRSLFSVLGGLKVVYESKVTEDEKISDQDETNTNEKSGDLLLSPEEKAANILKDIKKAIIVPGYGMAVAQAQQQVSELIKTLEDNGVEVKIAIHPVAGRMPGHMNVLLAEVGIPYEKLIDMDTINPEFAETDLVIAIGACDVINPAANTAEGSPIYGMPILNVEASQNVFVCNMDENPGYSGVDNSLYKDKKVIPFWGNAAETVPLITKIFKGSK